MTKYLALAKTKKGIVGFCFHDDLEKILEISSFPLDQINTKISDYQPQGFSQTSFYLLYNDSDNFQTDIMEVRNNFPNLLFFRVGGVGYLEKKIISENISIPDLERKPKGSSGYPEYYLRGQKISKAAKKALLAMYLHKPWSEISQVKFGKQCFWISDKDPKTNSPDKFVQNFSEVMNSDLFKNINMAELTPPVKELSEKLLSMSKLSYLGTLKADEIAFLVQKSCQFSQTLEKFYTLKKNEEAEEPPKESKISTNESNEITN